MSAIVVTPATLRSQSEALRTTNARFKSAIAELEASEGTLNSMWEGDANRAFHTAFNNDKTQMTNFYTLIEQYCDALVNIAQKYDQAENTNRDTATTRVY